MCPPNNSAEVAPIDAQAMRNKPIHAHSVYLETTSQELAQFEFWSRNIAVPLVLEVVDMIVTVTPGIRGLMPGLKCKDENRRERQPPDKRDDVGIRCQGSAVRIRATSYMPSQSRNSIG